MQYEQFNQMYKHWPQKLKHLISISVKCILKPLPKLSINDIMSSVAKTIRNYRKGENSDYLIGKCFEITFYFIYKSTEIADASTCTIRQTALGFIFIFMVRWFSHFDFSLMETCAIFKHLFIFLLPSSPSQLRFLANLFAFYFHNKHDSMVCTEKNRRRFIFIRTVRLGGWWDTTSDCANTVCNLVVKCGVRHNITVIVGYP